VGTTNFNYRYIHIYDNNNKIHSDKRRDNYSNDLQSDTAIPDINENSSASVIRSKLLTNRRSELLGK
jgi:hypothetical protein